MNNFIQKIIQKASTLFYWKMVLSCFVLFSVLRLGIGYMAGEPIKWDDVIITGIFFSLLFSFMIHPPSTKKPSNDRK